jgi:glycosyltransferase involved in cell wall biosynthesis
MFERILIEVSPDVVLIAHLMNHSPGYVDVAHRWGIPVAMELHDFFMLCPRAHLERRSGDLCAGPEAGAACARYCFGDQENAELRWVLRSRSFAEAVHVADEVLAPSPFVADYFGAARGDSPAIRIVENGVAPMGPTLRSRPIAEGPLRLASIGVTVKHKGFQVVVEALRLAELPESSYTIFGVALPPYATELQKAGDEVSGLRLQLANGFTPTQLPALLADSDVLIVPSLVPETYSIVTREAFACGLPVIASKAGALPTAIRNGENGWLFEPGDAVGLADLLRRLDGDREMLRRAAARIESEDVPSVAVRTDRIEALLKELTDQPGRRSSNGEEGRELEIMRGAVVGLDRGSAES